MRRYIQYRILIALLNVAVFGLIGIQQHGYWASNPKLASEPYERFSCILLERYSIPAAERENNFWFCCAECQPLTIHKLFMIANLGPFMALPPLLQTASHHGAANQVQVFYCVMPFAIFLWWYLLGSLIRLVKNQRRSPLAEQPS
jgi:hypothetical protein